MQRIAGTKVDVSTSVDSPFFLHLVLGIEVTSFRGGFMEGFFIFLKITPLGQLLLNIFSTKRLHRWYKLMDFIVGFHGGLFIFCSACEEDPTGIKLKYIDANCRSTNVRPRLYNNLVSAGFSF